VRDEDILRVYTVNVETEVGAVVDAVDADPGIEGFEVPGASLLDTVREPNVLEELRTARASIEHALFRLGGSCE
jgi:hypothetical protein